MAEKNNLTYDAWKEYLKNDREINAKWKSLIELWENVKKDLKENLNSLPYSEALGRRKFLTAKNIFNVINTAGEKPNFAWDKKLIYNEEDERDEYVIQCKNPSSDYIFRRIKEERGVTNMHGESIDKYLQPVADKIWALKAALKVSSIPETNENLWYDSVRMKLDDEHEVDPDYPKAPEWWRDPVQPWTESGGYEEEKEEKSEEKKSESEDKKSKENKKESWNKRGKKWPEELLLPFPDL